MQLQCQFSGQRIVIDTHTTIGGGGEGIIYPVVNQPSLVAKIYHKPTDEDGDKLAVMYSMPPDAPIAAPGHASIAWPVDLLRTLGTRGKIVGFLMPRVNRVSPIHIFYTPKTRREKKPLFNYLYLHRTARNLAAAVHALHARGYVIGDVNESNILVTDTALVTLVDTDSFQVRDPYTQFIYRCPVGKPEFTPPELQGQTFRTLDRLPEHDCFGLSVIIFQLLMEGTHPFAGVYQGSGEPPSIETRIQSGHFPYSTRKVPYKPVPLAPNFSILHPSIQALFRQCFEDGHRHPSKRPEAKDWLNALREAEASLITCTKNEQHRYGDHLKTCPWCERAKQFKGRDPFPSRKAVEDGEHLQPLKKVKRKRVPTTRVITPNPVYRSLTPANQTAPVRMTQRMGQYHPLITPVYFSPPTSTSPFSLITTSPPGIQGLIQDTFWGGVWGALLLAALMGVILGLNQGGSAILGAIFVGMIWGGFFGIAWSILSSKSNAQLSALFTGVVWGGFLLSAIGATIFGAIQQQAVVGQVLIGGSVLGMIWGMLWNRLKPPLSVPLPGREWGRRGAFLGAIWGTFLGVIVVSVAAIVLAMMPVIAESRNPWLEFIPLAIKTLIPAAGLGAMGGIFAGTLLGAIVGAPKLPLPIQLSGSKGGLLGALWGNFLGVMAGAVAGAILSLIFPHLLTVQPSSSEVTSFLIGAITVSSGFGSLWGLISGTVWGALGRW